MRGVLSLLVVGIWVGTAHADPYTVRNPAPDAPPSATVTGTQNATGQNATDAKPEVLDPGKSQRHTGVWIAGGGGVLLLSAFVVSYSAKVSYDHAIDRINSGAYTPDNVYDANHARMIARDWGTTLFLSGMLAAGVGAYIYFTAPIKIRREHVTVSPGVSADGLGFSISGGF